MNTPSLTRLLEANRFPKLSKLKSSRQLAPLQLKMLRIQQSIWLQKKRAIIVFEGFDASGKGGTIRKLVEKLDPRSFTVFPIGAPDPEEQCKHYMFRFWQKIPAPGCIAIFDRSWYGRVLTERVEGIIPKKRWQAAFEEIRYFEKLLQDDGIEIIKIFLAIDKKEQQLRFEERLSNPYKQWKLTKADIKARKKWREYVSAVDEMFVNTHTKNCPWHLIAANDKHYSRVAALTVVDNILGKYRGWLVKKKSK